MDFGVDGIALSLSILAQLSNLCIQLHISAPCIDQCTELLGNAQSKIERISTQLGLYYLNSQEILQWQAQFRRCDAVVERIVVRLQSYSVTRNRRGLRFVKFRIVFWGREMLAGELKELDVISTTMGNEFDIFRNSSSKLARGPQLGTQDHVGAITAAQTYEIEATSSQDVMVEVNELEDTSGGGIQAEEAKLEIAELSEAFISFALAE